MNAGVALIAKVGVTPCQSRRSLRAYFEQLAGLLFPDKWERTEI